eukprot:1137809-Pelagomonas_calceolata.AAC.1
MGSDYYETLECRVCGWVCTKCKQQAAGSQAGAAIGKCAEPVWNGSAFLSILEAHHARETPILHSHRHIQHGSAIAMHMKSLVKGRKGRVA